jgi:hypothetical protein
MAYTTINKGSSYFNTVLYTGDGTTNQTKAITFGFQPDLAWFKSRDAANSHIWVDSVRGGTKYIISEATNAEGTLGVAQLFTSTGMIVSNDASANSLNSNGSTKVSWGWLGSNTTASNTSGSISSTVCVNQTAGFSVVSYTGNATLGATVGHGLGSTCKLMIIKNRSISSNWIMYHPITLENRYMELNTTNAEAINFDYWNSTRPTSSVFTIGTANTVNGSGNSMIAYCFAEIKGYSKFGGYTGNGSTDGPFVYTGFKPAFILIKNSTSGSSQWLMSDNKRNTFNVVNKYLIPNLSDAEASLDYVDFLSNGFKLKFAGGLSINQSADTYIYMAFAENPFVSSTLIPTTAR